MDGEGDALDTELEIPEIDEEQDGEAEVTLDGEDAGSVEIEGESAVIRDFRKREREKDRELRELRQRVGAASQPALPDDPGPRPKLEAFGWDDDKHSEALDEWEAKKVAFEMAKSQGQQQAEQIEQQRRQAYQAAKTAQPIAGIEEAEKRVFDQVPEMMRNALLHAKSPAVVALLDKYPDRMNAIADLMNRDPAEALMMIGELRGKAKIMPKARRAPDPEEIATGTASMANIGGDKREAALEKAAMRDPSKVNDLLAYRRAQRRAAKAK